MDFYIQFGHGMGQLSQDMTKIWGGGTVVLSPRDASPKQLLKWAKGITKTKGAEVLLDPQFYSPRSNHHKIIAHSFWPSDYETSEFYSEESQLRYLNQLYEKNRELKTSAFILPNMFASSWSDDWLAITESICKVALAQQYELPLYSTIAIGADIICNDLDIQKILEFFEACDVEGIYLLPETPSNEYLVSEPKWFSGLLELVAGLKLMGKKVIVGYTNHQSLCLGVASADAICSGNWLNVRKFSVDNFMKNDDDTHRRRGNWYYAPSCLSECKLRFLDTAQERAILSDLKPPDSFNCTYSERLFLGPKPNSVDFKSSPDSFGHYFQALRSQTIRMRKATYQLTKDNYLALLDDASNMHEKMHQNGVIMGRSFFETFDAIRSAIAILDSTRGVMLKRKWAELQH